MTHFSGDFIINMLSSSQSQASQSQVPSQGHGDPITFGQSVQTEDGYSVTVHSQHTTLVRISDGGLCGYAILPELAQADQSTSRDGTPQTEIRLAPGSHEVSVHCDHSEVPVRLSVRRLPSLSDSAHSSNVALEPALLASWSHAVRCRLRRELRRFGPPECWPCLEMWAALYARSRAGGSLSQLLLDYAPQVLAELGSGGGTAATLLAQTPVLGICSSCKRSEVADYQPACARDGPQRPQMTFRPAESSCYASEPSGPSLYLVLGTERRCWVDVQSVIAGEKFEELLEEAYYPIRARLGVDHCATVQAAALLREQFASCQRACAAKGELYDMPCLYCLPDAARALGEPKLLKFSRYPFAQGFHCDDPAHAERVHAQAQLDTNMRWSCCGAQLRTEPATQATAADSQHAHTHDELSP